MVKPRHCPRCQIEIPDRASHPSCYCPPCRAIKAKGWAEKYRKPEPEHKPCYDFAPLMACLTP